METTERIEDNHSEKPVVCCATCHGVRPCPPEFKKICFMETETFLWWSQEHGYFPKLHENKKYSFWVPPFEGFITRKEFSV